MKKRIKILTMALLLTTAAQAQIFIMEDENNTYRPTEDINGEYGNIIYHGVDADQPNWVPIGEGLIVMTALGAVYLKKKKSK
jgi:hypothetical protein